MADKKEKPKANQSFEAAREWFAARTILSPEQWTAADAEAKAQAFAVASAAQADLVLGVKKSLDVAMRDGLSVDEWRKQYWPTVEAAWGERDAWRLETIYRINLQRSYNAGRFEQMTDPITMKVRPYWLFDATIDSRTTPGCRDADGTVLEPGDPWWKENYPPRHANCRSIARSITKRDAEKMGIAPVAPATRADEGFGALPGKFEEVIADKQRDQALAGIVKKRASLEDLLPEEPPDDPVLAVASNGALDPVPGDVAPVWKVRGDSPKPAEAVVWERSPFGKFPSTNTKKPILTPIEDLAAVALPDVAATKRTADAMKAARAALLGAGALAPVVVAVDENGARSATRGGEALAVAAAIGVAAVPVVWQQVKSSDGKHARAQHARPVSQYVKASRLRKGR